MRSLGFHVNDAPSHSTSAKLFNLGNRKSGTISVIFQSNWHSGEGPYLEVGDEIRGFGIQYMQFKPLWIGFTWKPSSKTLFVAGRDYEFSLQF